MFLAKCSRKLLLRVDPKEVDGEHRWMVSKTSKPLKLNKDGNVVLEFDEKNAQMRIAKLHSRRRWYVVSDSLWYNTQVLVAFCRLQPLMARLIRVKTLSHMLANRRELFYSDIQNSRRVDIVSFTHLYRWEIYSMNELWNSCCFLRTRFLCHLAH